MVPVLKCHMLLGRPWQSDRDVKHHKRSNKYSFVFGGLKHNLAPLTPSQLSRDYRVMKELRKALETEEIEKGRKEVALVLREEDLA